MGRCLSPWEEIQVFYGLVIEVFNFGEICLQFSLISAFRKRTVNKIFFTFSCSLAQNMEMPNHQFRTLCQVKIERPKTEVGFTTGQVQIRWGRDGPTRIPDFHSTAPDLKFGFKQDPFTDQDPIGWRTRGSDNDQPVMCDRKSCRTTNELGKVEVWVKLGKAHKKSCRGTSELGKAYVWVQLLQDW